MKTREQIEKELPSFSGGSDRLSKLYTGMCCTDGVRYPDRRHWLLVVGLDPL